MNDIRSAASQLAAEDLLRLVASYRNGVNPVESVADGGDAMQRIGLSGSAAAAEQSLAQRAVGPAAIAAAATAALVGGTLALRHRRATATPDDHSLSRRDFMSVAAATAAVARFGSVDTSASLPRPAELSGLNVLAIVLDDLNDYPTYMGGAPMPVHTPNLDALAAESRTFVNHHVTVPICPPSRATLMWGRKVAGHGVTDRGPLSQFAPETYRSFAEANENLSLPAVATAAGVTCYGGGKLFHGDQYTRHWEDFQTNTWATSKPDGGEYKTFFDMGPPLDDRFPDDDLRDFTIAKLRAHSGPAPFLNMMGIRHPHLPWRVQQRYLDLYPIDDIVLPDTPEDDWSDLGPIAAGQLEQYVNLYGAGWFEVVENSGRRAEHLQGYLAAMSHADALVGDVMNELASSPFADDTVVMLVSDNGYHQGENFAYRKLTLRNQATRTPFMIRGPAGSGFTPGTITDAVSSVNFMATVLDTLGVAAPAQLDGVSLRHDARPPAVITTHVNNSASLVYGNDDEPGGRWTFHFATDQTFDAATVSLDAVAEMEFYDHSADPNEFDNLLAGWSPG